MPTTPTTLLPPPNGSSSLVAKPTNVGSTLLTPSSGPIHEKKMLAKERALLLFRCYPSGQANHPETYMVAVSSVLSDYPESVIRSVTDPRAGIARQSKFLPSVAEIAAACDDAKALIDSVTPFYEIPRHGEVITSSMCPDANSQKHLGRIFLKVDSEEWDAWSFHLQESARLANRPRPILKYYFNNGWSFPACWPPGHSNATPAPQTE